MQGITILRISLKSRYCFYFNFASVDLPRKGDSTVARSLHIKQNFSFLYSVVFLVSFIQDLVHTVGFQVLSSGLFQEQLEF